MVAVCISGGHITKLGSIGLGFSPFKEMDNNWL